MARKNRKAPNHLPSTTSQSRTGEVSSSSRVPVRRSSATRRMVKNGAMNASRYASPPYTRSMAMGTPLSTAGKNANTLTRGTMRAAIT